VTKVEGLVQMTNVHSRDFIRVREVPRLGNVSGPGPHVGSSMKAARLSLAPPALVLAGVAVVLLLSDGSFRGVAVANDARVVFADSLFTWSAATHSDSVYTWSAATNVIPEVNGQATWHPETSSWTYTYTVKNDIASPNAIKTFGLAPVLEPQSIVAPTHWYQTYGFAERDDAVVWMVVDRGAPPVGWDSVSAYPSPFNIQPGDSVSSFSIVSPRGPGWITYYVRGYYDLPLEPEEPDAPTLFNNSITGTVVGPAGAVSGVDEAPLPSAIAELRPPTPNPARATVSVTFYLPEPSHVVLAVYDAAGRRVRVLVDGDRPSGVHSSSWDGYDESGRRVSAGVYFYHLRVGGKPAGTRRMVVVR
jgi:hypothetical protein